MRRFDAILIDEARDQDGEAVNGILVPTVSKVRLTAGGRVNPREPQQAQWYFSSASSKSSYNYEKVLDLFMKMVINPKAAFVFGLDYRIPVMAGIYPASFVRDIRLDSTMNDLLFAREYLSHFTAENSDSWFNFVKLNKHRKIVNAQWESRESDKKDKEIYFLISVDVGRISNDTVATIFKVTPKAGRHRAIVTNIFTLGRTSKTKQFARQAVDIKKLISAYSPKEVTIDVNGLGVGLADEMIKEQKDDMGKVYPAYGFYNDKEYRKIQPTDAPMILNAFRATKKINSEMFGNAYSRVESGLVDFLIKEQEARSKLMSTKRGQAMTAEQRARFLMPYEMTRKLFEEIGNLRLRRTGAGLDIALEPINSRFPDDKFSSLCIGLKRIKEIEEEQAKIRRGRGSGKRSLVFFSGRR